MSSENLIGLDVGTTSVKAVQLTVDGELVGKARASYPLQTAKPGWAEQDPDDWWRAAQTVLARLGGDPLAIGITGQMHGLVSLDRNGRPVRPAILWNDQRTAAECAEIERLLGLDRLVGLTGNRALTGFTAPKLLWLRKHEPDSYRSISRICLPKDYVRTKLTGDHNTDVTDASGTLLLDVGKREWSHELPQALDIPPDWLPQALESAAISGYTQTGLGTAGGVPVAAGAGDQAAGAVGVGVVCPGPLSVVLGTSGVVFAALPSFIRDEQARLHVFCHAVPDTWHSMGVMLSAAGSLQWLQRMLRTPHEELLSEAEKWTLGCEGLVFAPYLSGERTPHADPDIRGAFCGLDLRHDRGALCRAVLEGVAFGLRDSLELTRSLGVDPSVARVSGGGTRSRLWLQILAAVLGMPVELTAVSEGAAFGAAILGGVSARVFADVKQGVDSCVRVVETVEPDDGWVGRYDELYERFKNLYPTLRSLI